MEVIPSSQVFFFFFLPLSERVLDLLTRHREGGCLEGEASVEGEGKAGRYVTHGKQPM
jgi:hypothetical protein